MNFSERVYEDIGEVVGEFGFPAVIKSVNFRKRDAQHPEDKYIQDSLKLPRGSITLLERKLTLQFAHVTVIQFRDPDKIKKEKGIEFIESHKELEDKDYLLPLTYEGKCKIVHPPGKRKRYVDVTEVIFLQTFDGNFHDIKVLQKVLSMGLDFCNENVLSKLFFFFFLPQIFVVCPLYQNTFL